MQRLKAMLLATGLLALIVTPGLAGTLSQPLYSFSSSAPVSHEPTLYTLGFLFTTNVPITVTSLGYFDEDGDGFAYDHIVGIYDDNGNLITSITLDAGTTDPLTGVFRYHSITPITLASGQTYILAATSGGYNDGWVYGVAGSSLPGLTVDPAVTVASDAARYAEGSNSLQLPTSTFGGYTIYAGPNLIFTTSPAGSITPEPGSLSLGLAGLVLVALGLARKRKAR